MHCTSSWFYHILPYLGMKGRVGHRTKTGWSWNCFAKSLLSFDCSSSFWIGGLRSLWNDWWLWIEHDYWFMIYDVYGKAGWSPICSSYSAETTQVTWWYRCPSHASTPTAAMGKVSNVMLPGEDIRIGRGFSPERLDQHARPSGGLLRPCRYMKWWTGLWYVCCALRGQTGHMCFCWHLHSTRYGCWYLALNVRLTCQIQRAKTMRWIKFETKRGTTGRFHPFSLLIILFWGNHVSTVDETRTLWKHGRCINLHML